MKILQAKYILSFDENSKNCLKILQNHAIIFDNNIQKIQNIKEADFQGQIYKTDIAMPSLINAHTHLEFSANKAYMNFNGFANWLESVFNFRGIVTKKLKQKILQNEIKKILASGVGAIGNYSSFGLDLAALSHSPLRSRFFVEILGTNESFLENSWINFLKRFNEAKALENDYFKLGVAIHSPYSTHKILALKAIDLAKELALPLSAHFGESKAEMDFLNGKKSAVKETLKLINPSIKPLYSPDEFLELFTDVSALFIHCVHAKNLKNSKNIKHIVHCPRSNRFLSSGTLDIKNALKHANIALGTDGLSSNYSLDIWDEMRAALMIHQNYDLCALSELLLGCATIGGAKALALNSGQIKEGLNADIACFTLPIGSQPQRLALDLILHTKKAQMLFIGGEKII